MTAMDYDVDATRQQLEAEGYVVLPSFLEPGEIARLREIVGGFFGRGNGVTFSLGRTQPNAAMEVPELAFLFTDRRVTGFFRQLFGKGGALFTGHCDIHNSMVSNWHRDTGGAGHPYFEEPCFTDECRVYKMAFYLQDHVDGQGLTVRPGSHLADGAAARKEVSLTIRAGDAVVFDVRIEHRGREPKPLERAIQRGARFAKRTAAQLSGRPETPGQPEWTFHVREALDRMTGTQDRMSVFFTFGVDNRFSRQFARANMSRQLEQYAAGRIAYPKGLPEALSAAGVSVYQPEPQAAGR
jgi:hypothetical protein